MTAKVKINVKGDRQECPSHTIEAKRNGIPRPFWPRFPEVSVAGYLRSRAVDTFPHCPFSLTVKTPIPVRSLGQDPLE